MELLGRITDTIEATMDGTSGALYSIFLTALTSAFRNDGQPGQVADVAFATAALRKAILNLGLYTPARIGDRTVMDALIPFVDELGSSGSLVEAARASVLGAESTKALEPRLGRTVYIGSKDDWLGKVPDPGAWGLSRFLTGFAA